MRPSRQAARHSTQHHQESCCRFAAPGCPSPPWSAWIPSQRPCCKAPPACSAMPRPKQVSNQAWQHMLCMLGTECMLFPPAGVQADASPAPAAVLNVVPDTHLVTYTNPMASVHKTKPQQQVLCVTPSPFASARVYGAKGDQRPLVACPCFYLPRAGVCCWGRERALAFLFVYFYFFVSVSITVLFLLLTRACVALQFANAVHTHAHMHTCTHVHAHAVHSTCSQPRTLEALVHLLRQSVASTCSVNL